MPDVPHTTMEIAMKGSRSVRAMSRRSSEVGRSQGEDGAERYAEIERQEVMPEGAAGKKRTHHENDRAQDCQSEAYAKVLERGSGGDEHRRQPATYISA